MRRRTIVLMLLSVVTLSLSAQLYQGRNYYKSSYQPNTNQQLNRLESQGWEYLEAVNTYFYNGQRFARSGIAIAIYYKNLGNRTIFKATDGHSIFSVKANPDYQNPNSIDSHYEFYVVDELRRYLFFNI